MADDQSPTTPDTGQPDVDEPDTGQDFAEERTPPPPPRKRSSRKVAAKKMPATQPAATVESAPESVPESVPAPESVPDPAVKKAATKKATAKKATAKKATAKKAAAKKTTGASAPAKKPAEPAEAVATVEATTEDVDQQPAQETSGGSPAPLFQAPATVAPVKRARKRTTKKVGPAAPEPTTDAPTSEDDDADLGATVTSADDAALPESTAPAASTPVPADDSESASESASESDAESDSDSEGDDASGNRRRRRRGGRRRRKSSSSEGPTDTQDPDDAEGPDAGSEDSADGSAGGSTEAGRGSRRGGGQGGDETSDGDESADADDSGTGGSSRRRRRRRREGDDSGNGGGSDPRNTVTRVRKGRSAEDEITAVAGSTRLEAKKQRRREGREAGRRRAPIVSEAEFLARRESVERTMVIRQSDDLTQIGVLEDKVLVEHYVARESQTSLIGNVYVGRVQNVLPSMEAAFIDIGKGRNAVLYAGEVNWSALGHKDGAPRKIESVLSSGQTVLVQVTKDPVGHKGARLTSQVSLAGRFLVYVPDGTTSGISRKLADTERNRLKTLLKEIVPDSAGVIVRTAAEGASEDELTRDVERLKARWEDIESKVAKGSAPQLLYGEPDLTLKVVRDLFTEDFARLVIQGDDAWETVQSYVAHVAPDLEQRLERDQSDVDVFATYRIDEQIAKGLDRKVWLPSGGSLIIDRTEAMTVVDVNTGKFTGSGGNLEETVTKNNLEAAEEMVRQLRLRDIGGIIVIDFIDMVLESNRDLVLRRLVECLGRDRTRHQVAEVTSLGLVQMTRKKIGTGLLEAFSHACPQCQGRGVQVQEQPVEPRGSDDDDRRGGGSGRGRGRGRGSDKSGDGSSSSRSGSGREASDRTGVEKAARAPSPAVVAAMARADRPASEGPDVPDAHDDHAGGVSGQLDTEPEPQAVATDPAVAPVEAPIETPLEAPVEASAAPAVATRSRRRSASRPAGQPEGGEAVVLSVPVVAEPVADATSEGAAAAEGTAAVENGQGAPASAPKVVTRTRGSRARRTTPTPPEPDGSSDGASDGAAAGVPSMAEATPTVGSIGSPRESGLVEPGTAESEPGREAAPEATDGGAGSQGPVQDRLPRI